jgi:NAD(P)-dependent dehydrogenase (short-subunit alcohol dehydrogenase family)
MKKTIIITGASDGIGKAAARKLKRLGNEVVIVGRSKEKTEALAKELGSKYYTADFSSLEEVTKLAKQLEKDVPRIDVLVNNAGAVLGKRELSFEGNEMTMQVNHYAPFLLTNLLLPKLKFSNATIINTSSVANTLLSDFDINDLDLNKKYSPTKAYGNSKLANILFTKELDRRFKDDGISAVCFHPGNVATNFSKQSSSLFMKIVYRTPLRRLLLSPERGAKTLIWLASSEPRKEWSTGQYYVGKRIKKTSEEAYDLGLMKKFWQISLEKTGLAK